MTKFALKGLGNVSLILGMQESRDRLKGTLDINQGNYVKAILQRFGFVDSRSVYLYMFAGGPVTWSSKEQPVVTLLPYEYEHIALAYASQEAVYLSDLFSELTFPQLSSVQMYEDKMGALQLSGTTAFCQGPNTLYEIPFSARAGCIEQDHRISC